MVTLAQLLTSLPPDVAACLVIFSPFIALAGLLSVTVRQS